MALELWDAEGILNEPVAKFTSERQGQFKTNIQEDILRRKLGRRQLPKLYLKVFQQDKLIYSTKRSLLWDPTENKLDTRIEISISGDQGSACIVRGIIHMADGMPLSGCLVRVFAKLLRQEKTLGEQKSNADGQYKITYTPPSDISVRGSKTDLIIRAFDQNENLLATSQTVFNAKPLETVDIQVAEDHERLPSKYERINKALQPLLANRPISELIEDEEDDPERGKFQDLSYLSGETGIAVDQLALLVAAEKLGQATQVASEILYGLFRKGMPTDLYGLGGQDKGTLRKTLEQALEEHLLPAHMSAQLDQELEKLFSLPEIKLLKKPVFLAKPEVLFSPLAGQNALGDQERSLIDAKLNRQFRDMLIGNAGMLSETMHSALQSVVERLEYQDNQDTDPATLLRDSVLPSMKRNLKLSGEIADIEQHLSEKDSGQTIGQLLHLDRPLQDNPIFFAEIRRAKTLTYAGLANLSEAAASHLVNSDLAPDEYALADLVGRELASEEQAADLQLILDLARLSGDNLSLIQDVKTTGLKSTMEMITWSHEDWLRRITASGDSLPPEENPETYANNILANIELTYPSQTLLTRTLAPEQTGRVSRLDRLQPLLVECGRLIDGRKPAAIDWQSVNVAEPESLQRDLVELAAFANTYRYLGIAELINDRDIILDQKKETIGKRLQLLETFSNNNPGMDLRLANFISQEDDTLNWQDIPDDDRPLVRKQMMAFQRVLSLAGDTQNRQQLLSKGFDSSRAIASQMLSCFIAESGLSENVARQSYNVARKKTDSIIHSVETIRDTIMGDFSNIGMAGNTGFLNLELYNAMREVDGLDDLFGSQDYCACEECRSILSPAAYFVDLMRFIEENISNPVQAKHSVFANHSLYLKRRRSDLWKLNLTCENTHTLIPYLTIVNEVLSGYLELVLGKKDVFKELSNKEKNISFNLPFSLPMAELRLYLGHFGITLHGLCQLLDQPQEKIWRTRLDLSKQEFDVIITPDTGGVKYRYGNPNRLNDQTFDVQEFLRRTGINRDQLDDLLALGFNPDLKKIHILNIQDSEKIQIVTEYFSGLTASRLDFIHRFIRLWNKSGWTIRELDLILCALKDTGQLTRLVRPYLHSSHTVQPDRISIDFIRLHKDLRSIDFNQSKKGLHRNTVEHIARLVDFQQALKLSVEELCAMIHQLPVSSSFPNKPASASQERLMDTLFDIQELFEGKAEFDYHHYSLNKQNDHDNKIDAKTPLLVGALGISETELLFLFELLQEQMPFDSKGDTKLDRKKISLLYRHARLAKALKWSIEEFVQALKLIFTPDNLYVETLQQIYELQAFRNWLKSSPFTVFELAFLLQDTESSSNAFRATLEDAAGLVQECQQKNNLVFTKHLLAEIEGISAKHSEEILQQMAKKHLLDAVGGGYSIHSTKYRLTHDFSIIFTALTALGMIDDKVSKKEPEIREKLNEYHPLAHSYMVYANIDQETFQQVIHFASIDPGDDQILNALKTGFDADGNPETPDSLQPLLVLLKVLERTLFLFDKLKFKPKDMGFVADNPEAFGIMEVNRLMLHDLRALVTYRHLIPSSAEEKSAIHTLLRDYQTSNHSFAHDFDVTTLKDLRLISGITEAKHLKFGDLRTLVTYRHLISSSAEEKAVMHTLLQNYQNKNHLFANDSTAVVFGDIWKVDASLVESLIRSLCLPPVAIEALAYLKKALDYCLKLGINGFSLQKLVAEENYQDRVQARDVALGAFSSKYEDEKLRSEKLEPYQDRINTLKRDALCDYIIAREKDLKFEDPNDIYNFFLLDVEMSGCFRTSRIVCGLSSLQLYVHRVLANLEQSASKEISVLQDLDEVLLSQIRQEWEWGKNYRVWEANRKVFLYPENYLEPDLRDNKTPIFKELEEELLQEKITEESAEAAYKKYLTQFAELARLRIAGTYYHEDTDSGTGTYYFFGRTQQDPPQYYYRTWDQKAWAAWEKIELGINADYVSAVIHQGKLYLFWVERKDSEVTAVKDGSSNSTYTKIETTIFYSFLTENNRWISPQRIDFDQSVFEVEFLNNLETSSNSDYKNHKRDVSKCYKRIYLRSVSDTIDCSIMPFFKNEFPDDTHYWYKLDLFRNSFNKSQKLSVAGKEGNYLSLFNSSSSAAFVLEGEIIPSGWNIESYGFVYTSSDTNKITSSFPGKIFQPDIDAIPSKPQDYVIKLGNQQYLTQWKPIWLIAYRNTIRLTTSLVDRLGKRLLDQGLEAFLSLTTQKLPETSIDIEFMFPWLPFDPLQNSHLIDHIDFRGAYGKYYRELFFHIPFLIAHHLNANQKFEEAKWWYERIFDPTGTETPNAENPNERNWRYLEFRELSMERIKDILTDEAAIEQYEKDPFSPHAIARLRLSAYQKTIVMKYIDNLLDWGDSLFARDTIESINEANMLYVLAADILGKRPVELGKCDTVSDRSLTYEKIMPNLEEGDDFLITMENWNLSISMERPLQAMRDHMAVAVEENPNLHFLAAYDGAPEYRMRDYKEMMEVNKDLQFQASSQLNVKPAFRPPHLSVIDSTRQVFCVPPNVDLLKHWDRVEDRLFKIRHCMNISGVRRQLALFQPPIDPMALVRAKAAGLSMDDILNMMGAQLPPYRFGYLIEKARQFTQTVQSFGSALLSALEKKDVEELTLLRSVHERNIMKLTKQIKKQQLAEAQYQYQSVVETKTNIQNRVTYYRNLIDTGLTQKETVQQISTHTATIFKGAEGIVHLQAAIRYLLPNSGSPFAITYGGKQLGNSETEFAQWTSSMAAVANQIASSAGLEASWDRREQEWSKQLLLAEQELTQVEQQRLAADIRQLIAQKDLENHEKQMEQADELDAFYKNKFTNLGLYTYLSTTLHRLYREAYNIAYDMAKMAEQAYQFERDDDLTFFIAGDNWHFDRAGLLAGERLLLQLQHMEKAYLEKNTRECEVTQSFSLALLNPNSLLDLRHKGVCDFELPEIAYDLVYPGQYKRIIKSIRLTIPSVSGPYTNIGATLTLKSSQIRREEIPGEAGLRFVPHQKYTSIATSSSVNDGGVFELNFRDERYLPFEGAGAVSSWGLSLPKVVRQFDYNTISDVVIHVSYTARYSETFKEGVEAKIADNLIAYSETDGLSRMFSLQHEFPDAFHQLLATTELPQLAEIEIKQQHFPYFLSNHDLLMSEVTIFVRRKVVDKLNLSNLTVKGKEVVWDSTKDIGDIQEGSIESFSGSPLGIWRIEKEQEELRKDEVADILIVVKYKT